MNVYATLAQIRAYLQAAGTTMSTSDDEKLTQYLIWSSRLIDRRCHRRFYPRIETRHFDYQDTLRLFVDDDLLAVETLTVDDSTIANTEWLLYPLTQYPKAWIEIKHNSTSLFTYSGTPQDCIQVTGTWGYHDDWDNAWVDSQDTVQDDPLTNAATSLTVADADGVDINGLTPRFSVGSLLKIEDEYLVVTTVNTSTNTLTVQRGVNGTTAAQHTQGTTIYTFIPFTPAVTAVLDLTKWIYEHRNAVGGIIALPSLEGTAIQSDVDKILAAHRLPVRPPLMIP